MNKQVTDLAVSEDTGVKTTIVPTIFMAGRRFYIRFILMLLTFISVLELPAQHPSSFHKLTVADGLNDGNIHAIGQDKYGYIWIGSAGGLNRYNGREVKWHTAQPGDSTKPLASLPQAMALDSNGRFWIGFETGVMEYDYDSGKFINVPAFSNTRINEIYVWDSNRVFVATQRGLARMNPATKEVNFIHTSITDSLQKRTLGRRILDMDRKGDWLYLASISGLWRYNTNTNKAEEIPVKEIEYATLRTVCVDANDNIWLGCYGSEGLMRLDKNRKLHRYQRFLTANLQTISNNVNDIFRDNVGRIWIITTSDGLLEYLPASDSIRRYLHQTGMPQSPLENLHGAALVDREGNIWTGGNKGVNYFHPDKQLFQTLLPFKDDLDIRNRALARSITEDADGNLWMATMDGVSRYNPKTNSYREWNNQPGKPPSIWYNSVRGITTDVDNNIWIATGAGINRYDHRLQKMEFISSGKLPTWFYFNVNKDRQGRIWFSCRDGDGFYWYDPADQSFHRLQEHPQLKVFVGLGGRIVYHDSRGRYWLGLNGNGLGMYDPFTQKTFHYATGNKDLQITGDIVVDITEDKSGIIWVSTLSGINGIDTEKGTIQRFTSREGLLSNSTSALRVDSLNRLWIATARGINVFDSSRTSFTPFGIHDGLPADAFPEHAAYTAGNGDFIFPSVNGFVRFNPMKYKPASQQLSLYLSGVNVFNKPYNVTGEISDLRELYFKPGENYFTLQFTSLNYENPGQSWYAYKLDGFDQDWVITQQPEAHYTNVPGGRYTFRFKVSTDAANWEVPEESLDIHIAIPLYRRTWFLALIAATLASVAYLLYQRRVRKREEMLSLKNKSQLLEKEKAMVMYESLKQQLNPHFLFNSLTSLRSLIRANPQEAGHFLDGLSKTYRYILKSRDSETVSLVDELKFAETFLQLQLTRFTKGLEWKNRVSPEYFHYRIVPVTIQNMIENAIKHNQIDEDAPLVIELDIIDEYLVIRNNLQKKEFVETSNQHGLRSLQNLYSYMTDRPIRVEETEKYFTISIPLLQT